MKGRMFSYAELIVNTVIGSESSREREGGW